MLPLLQSHAAYLLETTRDSRAQLLADLLRQHKSGGNAVDGLNQNWGRDDVEFPEELETLWRVLVAFEHMALGGEIVRDGVIARNYGDLEQPRPWMLRAAANVLQKARGMDALTAIYRSVPQPAYHRLQMA